MKTSEKCREAILLISNSNFTADQLVSILILTAKNLDILTISKMARKEGKTPTGIKISNNYLKQEIGGQLMAIKGASQNEFPF